MTTELPPLREVYAKDFRDQVKRSADALRHTADQLEEMGALIEKPDAHAGIIASQLLHILHWSLANGGSLSAVVRAAAEHDRVIREEKAP